MPVMNHELAELVNLQRVELLSEIRPAETAEQLRTVRNKFEMVRPWMLLTGWTGEAEQIRIAIRMHAIDLRYEEQALLEGDKRKNSKHRTGSERHIRELTEIIATMA